MALIRQIANQLQNKKIERREARRRLLLIACSESVGRVEQRHRRFIPQRKQMLKSARHSPAFGSP